MLQAHHRGLRHGRMGVQGLLDLDGVDVQTSGDDHVAGPALQPQAAPLVEAAHVAGDEPPVLGAGLGGRVGPAPVARADIGTPHLDHPRLSRRRTSVLAPHPHLDARQGEAHGARHPGPVVGVRGDHQRLAHPVALQHLAAGAVGHRAVQSRGHRRRSRHEEPDAAAGRGVEPASRQQPVVVGGHPHHHGGFGQLGEHRRGLESLQEDHLAGAEHGGVKRHHESVHMEDGQSVQQHVGRPERPGLVEGQRVAGQVAVGEHGPLGPAGRARRVDEGGKVFGPAGCEGIVGLRSVEPIGQGVGVAHNRGGLGVAHEPFDLGFGVGRVDRHVHRAEPQHAEVQGHGLD